jgi:hypothetical protein
MQTSYRSAFVSNKSIKKNKKIQINTWAFPYWPGYHPRVEGQYGSRDDNQANMEMISLLYLVCFVHCIITYLVQIKHLCMTNMTGSKLSILSHPGEITGYWILQDHFHIEPHIAMY